MFSKIVLVSFQFTLYGRDTSILSLRKGYIGLLSFPTIVSFEKKPVFFDSVKMGNAGKSNPV